MKHQWLKWFILLLTIFLPRLLTLDHFLTADEPLFLQHAQAFAAGVTSGDFGQTAGIGYPGVTVAAWAAPWVTGQEESLATYGAGRFALGLLNGLLLLALIVLAGRLLGGPAAWTAGLLLALDPFLLGYSRLLHLEAVLAALMTLAGVSLLLWLQQERRRYLLLTGLFIGLALLTKSTALLLGPMLAGLLLVWAATTGNWAKLAWWRTQLFSLALGLTLAMVVFFLLWPAMWVDPLATLSLSLGKLLVDQEAGAGNLGMFWLGRFVEDPGPLFYPVAFLLKATPWLLAGLVLSLGHLVRSRGQGTGDRGQGAGSREQEVIHHSSFIISLPLWLFALIYLCLMTLASKKSLRYLLPTFPVFYLLAGSALYQLYAALNSRNEQSAMDNKQRPPLPSSRTPTLRPASPSASLRASLSIFQSSNPLASLRTGLPSFQSSILPIFHPSIFPLFLTLSLLTFTFIYHPYYLTYYNPALLGWRWAPHTLLVGWGEGLDGAARYLNQQPPQTVAAWYEWLLPLMYKGQVKAMVPQENLLTADRTVLYLNQVQRDIPSPNIVHYFRRRGPEQTIRLNGIDYAWIYSGPIIGAQPPAVVEIRLSGEFGGETRLLGYTLSSATPGGGEPLGVTLYWEILAPPPAERFVFLRLVDAQGRIWARADSPPVLGLWPIERWQPGMFIEDAQELLIPAGTPPARYRLEVGLYDPANGQPLAAVGQPPGPGGGLLLGEIAVEWRPSPALTVDLPHRTASQLSPAASLIGFDSLPSQATSGDLFTLNLAWRESGSWLNFGQVPADYVQLTWSRASTVLAEQLEPLPLPVEQWGRGAVLRSQHDLIVPPTLESGRYDVHIALHTGSDPAGESFELGLVDVTAPPHTFILPADALKPVGTSQLNAGNATIALTGYVFGRRADQLDLQLYWQTDRSLSGRYKVFVQLLTDEGALVAQADADPAAGRRPTSGWLPGEIITDSHSLTLPLDPPPPYRLITGLYDPRTGRRLPLLDPAGQPFPDAIFVTNEQ
jgi:hypothetical protein